MQGFSVRRMLRLALSYTVLYGAWSVWTEPERAVANVVIAVVAGAFFGVVTEAVMSWLMHRQAKSTGK